MTNIKLYFLQASRSIRTAWQLAELGLDYEVKFANRENGAAPSQFKEEAGGLGKFPTLEDGGEKFYESGNICEYLCDKYDTQHKLLAAPGDPNRYKVLQWVHAAEGTFMLHGLACLYARWFQKGGDPEETEKGLGKNVVKDMDYLDAELGKNSGKFLFGDEPTAADIQMHFSASFILTRQLGVKGSDWPRINQWIKNCEDTATFKQAVQKTGHSL